MEVSATTLDQQLVQKTKAFAEESIRRLPDYVVFHNLRHTLHVADAVAEISQAMRWITYTIFMIGPVLAILSYILSAVLYYRIKLPYSMR